MHNVNILDNATQRHLLDSSEMGLRIAEMAPQCQDAWEQVFSLELPEEYQRSNQMIVAGMGGSGIGGDLLADLALTESSAPVSVWRDYNLPPWANNQTLVIASSYSGNTHEVLSAFQTARARNCNLIALTRGGSLRKLAEDHGIPLLPIQFNGEPRTALGYSFTAPLALGIRLNLLPRVTVNNLARTIKRLREITASYNPESALRTNPAKQLAEKLVGHTVVIYASNPLSAAARRWKTQLNENAKTWAFAETLPELQHNSIIGYENPKGNSRRVFVVLLEPNTADQRLFPRYQITKDLLQKHKIPHQTFEFKESSSLENILHAVLLGDFTSYYLALLNGVDPTPVPAIEALKNQITTTWEDLQHKNR